MTLSKSPSEKPKVSKGYLLAALLCCIGGGTLALYATNLTLLLANHLTVSNDGCSINEWISCNAVLSTKFAIVFGLPVAWLGFLFYLWAAITLIVALLRKDMEKSAASASAVLVGGSIAVLFSIYKAFQLVMLEKLCPVCVGMYIINISIVMLLMPALGLKYLQYGVFLIEYFKNLIGIASRLTFSPRPVLYSIAVIWILTLGYVGMVRYENYFPGIKEAKEEKPFNLEEVLTDHFDKSPVEIRVDPDAAVIGDKDAVITIVEFADFECPACKMLMDSMHKILKEYDGKVKLYFMNYPLDISINKYMTHDLHKYSGLAAIAGVYAQKQGEFWSFQDELFEDQENINREFLNEVAERRSWNLEEFKSCLDDSLLINRVKSDIEAGELINMQGTPSLYINGRPIEYWNKPEFIKAVINEELKRTQFL